MRFEFPGLELLVGVARLAEDMAAFGLGDEIFEDRLRFLVDFERALAGPALEPGLDDEIAPVSTIFLDEVGEIPPETQFKTEATRQKMLRLAQEKYLFRIQDRRVATGLQITLVHTVGHRPSRQLASQTSDGTPHVRRRLCLRLFRHSSRESGFNHLVQHRQHQSCAGY